MSQSVADEREHRRGLVLGLTLAEILLLLLFLLLLALGARLQRMQAEASQAKQESSALQAAITNLEPLLAELRRSGELQLGDAKALVERLARVSMLETALHERNQQISELRAQLSVLNALGPDAARILGSLQAVISSARKIDPNDPPAVLRRALAVLEKVGVGARPEQVTSLSEMEASAKLLKQLGPEAQRFPDAVREVVAEAVRINPNDPPAVLKQALDVLQVLGSNASEGDVNRLKELIQNTESSKSTIATLQEERDRFRRERDNLMRGGRGLVFPSCWTSSSGETEYIFEVSIFDEGLYAIDKAPLYRMKDEAWAYVDQFPRGVRVPESSFLKATSRLFDWSRKQECRFVVTMLDFTGPSSKERYKHLQRVVERHFYVRRVENSPSSGPGIGGPLDTTPKRRK